MKLLLRGLALAAAASLSAQSPAPERLAALRTELEAMHETDQAQRREMSRVGNEFGQSSAEMSALWTKQTASDQFNIKRLEEIIAEIGWPKRSEVGERAASAAFLILQHSDVAYQKKYLALTRAAVAAGEMRASSLALLEDRILLREGKRQIYGSQVSRNAAGQWEARDLDDPENVDARRASVGLPPLADYLAGFAQRSGGTVADGKADKPAPDAPPLTQALFSATDDARTAYNKMNATKFEGGEAGVQLQLACRDFCARFPDSPFYPAVRMLAANRAQALREADFARLGDWDPGAAERDPKLTREQQATVAMQTAIRQADRRSREASDVSWAQRRLDAAAAAARNYRGSPAAREALMPVALDAPPESARAVLRELYPDDPVAAGCLAVIDAIGQPCEFQLATSDGQTRTAADFRGRVTLLVLAPLGSRSSANLWPQLKPLTERNAGGELALVWISLDRNREAIEEFVKSNDVTGPVHFDGLGWSTPLAARFRVRTAPYYLLIDRQGVLRFRGLGPTTKEAAARIDALITERPAN